MVKLKISKKIKVQILSVALIVVVFVGTFSSKLRAQNVQIDIGFVSNMEYLKEISQIMDLLDQYYVATSEIGENINKTELKHGAVKGMVEALDDPYSTYFTKEELISFQEDIQGEYDGVGMVIQKKKGEYLSVVSPIDDTPAYKAGIKPKDKIVEIAGESTFEMTSEEAVKLLKGKAGTPVKVKVYRESSEETREIVLTRAKVSLKYVKSEVLEDNIGYIKLTQFGEGVGKDVEDHLKKLEKKDIKGLVFDLRNNPGGSLEEAIEISSFFMNEGTVVSVKTKNEPEEFYERKGKYHGDFPLVVLINEGSASASEIFSGAMKDHKRGTLIGEKSFGKGSVQRIVPLPDGDGIKLTIAKYYTPSGVSIHGTGIEPDITVESDEDYLLGGSIINIDEEATDENKKEILKEVLKEDAYKKVEDYEDIQLKKAIDTLKEEIK